MSTALAPSTAPVRPVEHPVATRASFPAVVVTLVALLGLVAVASLLIGSKAISPATVWQALVHFDHTDPDHLTIVVGRLARTCVGLLAGVALGCGGAVLQGVTRNPIADPGILGINAGAALAVVIATTIFGITAPVGYVWFACAGAALAALAVAAIAARSGSGATPVPLALGGAAITAAASGLVAATLLTHQAALDQIRFWQVGALAGRGFSIAIQVAPLIVVGAIGALAIAPGLNALALGDDVATGLGQRVGRTRALALAVVVATCGAATATVGPIAFVGLIVPHMARRLAGVDYRRIVALSALIGPALLLGADVLGRVIARPGEVEVGVITALVGAPVFIALIRRGAVGKL